MTLIEIYAIGGGILATLFMIAEFYQVWAVRRMIQGLINDPENAGIIFSNAIHGFMAQLTEDTKEGHARRNNFFGFMQIIGQNIMAGATGSKPGEPMKPVKLRGNMKILEPIINNPTITNMFANMLKDKIMGGATKKGAQVAETAVDELFGL